MSLDFQSIRDQVRQLADTTVIRERELVGKLKLAAAIMESNAEDLEKVRQKVEQVVRNHDHSLRCALPVKETLTASFPQPDSPRGVTIIAADGSQITPDRNMQVNYALINVGAIQMSPDSGDPPGTATSSKLLYDEQLYTSTGRITEASLALKRDLGERGILADLAEKATPPVVTFTDGPMELWGGKTGDSAERAEFQDSLRDYLEALKRLNELGVITAGYVDKPSANLVVRTLEVLMTAESELPEIKNKHPLRGVTDFALYNDILATGERSPVFALQSQSAKSYAGPLVLHFFYLNVGRENKPYLARVEIPAWVVEEQGMLDVLHAVLVEQCLVLGTRPYPYLLHRAHETAVVKNEEREQVTQMIVRELLERGVSVDEISSKLYSKQLTGRTRF